MKWLLTLLAGALIGALTLFLYLREIGDEPAGVAVAPVAYNVPVSPTAGLPAQPVPLPAPAEQIAPPDLAEEKLPIRPPQPFPLPDLEASAPSAGGDKLMVPVEGISYAQLADNFNQPRGKERKHEALDIMAPKGTKVVAVADGKITKLFNSKAGGLTVYQFDPSEKLAYYYAHLDKYADGLQEGQQVKRGDLIGYVGVTGNSQPDAPHLHFAVVELTPEKQWWKGTPLNPYPMMAD